MPVNMAQICEFALASVVYHKDFVLETLPASHSLFRTSVFRNSSVLNQLFSLIDCRSSTGNDRIQATGIPPHTQLLMNLLEISDSINSIIPAVNQATESIAEKIIQELEDRAIGAGTVTRDGLQQLLSEVSRNLLSFMREEGILSSNNQVIDSTPAPINFNNSTNSVGTHFWGGRFHHVPESFDLGPMGTDVAFELWLLGDESRQFPPYKLLSGRDMSSKNLATRFGEFKFLMSHITRVLQENNRWVHNANVEQVKQMFIEYCELDVAASRTPKGRIRRLGQIVWSAVAKNLRSRGL
eukprot:NODE_959_length_2884_cov_0.214363.p1 type:complete len:297 gc:universal NODE_959_length_2884_cov_0.214363:657-1547(+)